MAGIEDLMTAAEVAEMLRIKPRTWHSYVSRGDAGAPQPVKHIGRTPVWDRAEIKAWQAGRMHATYHLAKAREVMRRAGGNPDLAGPLAEWAKKIAAAGDNRAGAIVAEDGTILAESRRARGDVGAYYVTADHIGAGKYVGSEEGLAHASLQRDTGMQAIQVSYNDVCRGPRPPEDLWRDTEGNLTNLHDGNHR